MKLLVLGCNGMAGHVISLYFLEKGYQVEGFAKTPSPFMNTVIGDAMNTDLLSQTIRTGSYGAVINSIGILNQFAERHRDKAVFLNAYLPHFLVETTKDQSTTILHMSTDCVFSGKNGPYAVQALRDGETFYDRSKALGELEDQKNITFRSSIVGPDLKPDGIGLMNWFMQQEGEINGYTGSIWTGQTTLQLAKTMEAALKQGVSGLFNAVPEEAISKYELLQLFNHFLRREPLRISPVVGTLQDKTLLRGRDSFAYTIPSYETMVRELADWMDIHRRLYPHYA